MSAIKIGIVARFSGFVNKFHNVVFLEISRDSP